MNPADIILTVTAAISAATWFLIWYLHRKNKRDNLDDFTDW